jgi:hypothetical protein
MGNFTAVSSEAGSTFEVSLNGNAYQVVASSFTVNAITDGTQNLSVRARDAAGNADASPVTFSWTVDTQAPDTALNGGPASPTTQTTASFTLSSPESGATFEASLDGAAFAAATSPLALSGLAAGAHTLHVRARDAAGNTDGSPATHSWTVTSAPAHSVRIIFPGQLANTEAGTITLRGTANSASGTITALNVEATGLFSIPASTTDGFQNWTASIPVTAAGSVVVDVSMTVTGGAVMSNLAQATIVNSGQVIADLRGVLFEPGANRLLALDSARAALLRLRTADGYAEVLSDANHGTGPVSDFGHSPLLDAANNRVLFNTGNAVLAVNLSNGNRTEIVSAQGPANLSIYGSLAFDAGTNTIYGNSGNSIIRIDVASGVRSVLTGQGVGNGTDLDLPRTVRLDTSGVSGSPRLLVSQVGGIAVVDLATGDRSLLPGSNVYPDISDFVVDAANDRLLVLVPMSPTAFQIGALSLVNGASGMYSASNFEVPFTSGAGAFIALDGNGGNAYLGTMDRSRILRYHFPSSTILPFYDTRVGSGATMGSTSNLDLDESGPAPMLYSSARYPKPGVVRLDLSTSARTVVSMENVAGSGPIFSLPNSIALDRRPNAPPNNLLVVDEGFLVHRIAHVDLTTGTRTLPPITLPSTVDYYYSRPWILDAPRGVFLRGMPDPAAVPALGSLNATDGTVGVLSSAALGAGPTFNEVGAVRVESLAGGGYRYIVADSSSSQIFAVDPATGNRTLVSSNVTGTGPAFPYIHDIEVDSTGHRALVVGAGSLLWVNLGNGDRTAINGPGPALVAEFMRMKASFATGVAYVKSQYQGDGIVAVDLLTGERALVSR